MTSNLRSISSRSFLYPHSNKENNYQYENLPQLNLNKKLQLYTRQMSQIYSKNTERAGILAKTKTQKEEKIIVDKENCYKNAGQILKNLKGNEQAQEQPQILQKKEIDNNFIKFKYLEKNTYLNNKNRYQKHEEYFSLQQPLIVNKLQQKFNSNRFPSEKNAAQLNDEQNEILSNQYSKEVEKYLVAKDLKLQQKNRLKNCLQQHNIEKQVRARMVDWQIEVISTYKLSDQTFFLSLEIMDQYLAKSKQQFYLLTIKLDYNDIHLIGIVSMFIASKYEEIYPLKLNFLKQKISHDKFTTEQILSQESEMIQILEFNCGMPTIYELMTIYIQQMNLKKSFSTVAYNYLMQVTIYLNKMVMHDYQILNEFSYTEIASGIIFVSFKIFEQLDKEFPLQQLTQLILQKCSLNEGKLLQTATKILNVAKNFEDLYPQLINLKKFNGFSLDDEYAKQIQQKGYLSKN